MPALSSSRLSRVAPSPAAGTVSAPSAILSRLVPIPSSSSSTNNRNNSVLIATDDELDRRDLQVFVDDIVPQERSSSYSDDENASINNAIIINEKRLKDPRWKPLAASHHACKQFMMIEDGESIAIGRGEGIIHCSAALAMANCWLVCNRRNMKEHFAMNGADNPREIYRVVNKHHQFYRTYKVCLSLSFPSSFSFPSPYFNPLFSLSFVLSHKHLLSFFLLSFSFNI
jgi:hypothetical protein